jgi:asparagine synthase (glutamine-hydrolysing)
MMGMIPSRRIPVLRNKYNFHNRYEKLKLLLKDPSDENMMLKLSQQYTDQRLNEVLQLAWKPLETAYLSKELQHNRTPLAYMMAVDYQTYLLDDILQKVDRATMSQSLEGREPFLDQHIIEFAARLPDDYKYHQGVKKRILRDIVHQYVPKELMDRPKMGFAIPIGKWMMKELRDLVETQLSEERIRKDGILNPEFVRELKRDFFNGKLEFETKIWYLLTFQMWYEKWMIKP